MEDEATKELETIQKTNARKIQKIVAERRRYEIERQKFKERARGDARRGKGEGKAECQGVAQIDAVRMS